MRHVFVVPLSLVLLLLAVSSVTRFPTALGSLYVENGVIKADVYVIRLTGVDSVGVGNVSRIVDGIYKAVENVEEAGYTITSVASDAPPFFENVSSHIFYGGGGGLHWLYLKMMFPVNVTVHMVTEWEDYERLVEDGGECVVVNTHGAVIPVPRGYSADAWIDRVADAMLNRNVTWVHLEGYTFRYAAYQDGGTLEDRVGQSFQRLMQHIERDNATVQEVSDQTASNPLDLSAWAELVLTDTWGAFYMAKWCTLSYPLALEDFGDLAIPIWNSTRGGVNYCSGAIIRFKSNANSTQYGFYVHLGINQTSDVSHDQTDSIYYRGFFGVGAGLWALISRNARETLLAEAEAYINLAASEDRTEGLQDARRFLETAKMYDRKNYDYDFTEFVYMAMVAAETATKKPPEGIDLLLGGSWLGFFSFALVGVVVWQWKKHKGD